MPDCCFLWCVSLCEDLIVSISVFCVCVWGVGFPCQSFSERGDQLGLSDPRGIVLAALIDLLVYLSSFLPTLVALCATVAAVPIACVCWH